VVVKRPAGFVLHTFAGLNGRRIEFEGVTPPLRVAAPTGYLQIHSETPPGPRRSAAGLLGPGSGDAPLSTCSFRSCRRDLPRSSALLSVRVDSSISRRLGVTRFSSLRFDRDRSLRLSRFGFTRNPSLGAGAVELRLSGAFRHAIIPSGLSGLRTVATPSATHGPSVINAGQATMV